MLNKIVFFFPWKTVSGGPNYLSQLANDLAQTGRYKVYYVDYPEGLTEEKLTEKVHRIVYTRSFCLPIQEPVTLVTPVYCAPHIPPMAPSSKILFINWHNYCLQALLDVWRLSEEDLQVFLQMISSTQSEFFVDHTHWLAQRERVRDLSNYQLVERVVPVVVSPKKKRAKQKLVREDEINIAVLGRLSEDKIYGVLNLLHEIDRLPIDVVKHIYIIGEGPQAHQLHEYLLNRSIQLHMMGTIVGQELDGFLAQQVDILFAMGLSVLEGGLLALPSVVIPHNIAPFSCNAFTYLQECRGYALGWYDTQISEINIPVHPISQILKDIYLNGKKEEMGERAYAYTHTHHFSNVHFFEEALADTSLTAAEFAAFSKKQGKIRFCGIPIGQLDTSFDETEKFVSVFGIRNILAFKRDERVGRFFLFGREQTIISAEKIDGKYRLTCFGIRIPFIKL